MFKQLVITFAIVSLFAVFTVAQEQTETTTKEKKECAKGCCSGHKSHDKMTMAHVDADSTHSDHKHHQMKSTETEEVSIVREGEIDLVAIDVNGDGMVYQDQMCWNVISDEPGECPQCGMILKEVSLEQAKANLEKNDYEVK
jgi:Ni/Co efflux regulator RcnB